MPFSRIYYTDLEVGTEVRDGIIVKLYGRGLHYLDVVYINGCSLDVPRNKVDGEATMKIDRCHRHLKVGTNVISSRLDKDEVLIEMNHCFTDNCRFPDGELIVTGN